MSGAMYFHEFEPDSLSDDDSLDARAKFLLSDLERQWDLHVANLRREARALAERFTHYDQQCESAQRNRWKIGFNPIGELQGCTYQFDAMAKAIRDIEDTIDGVRNILYPEPAKKSSPVKSSGATNRPRKRSKK